MNLRYTSRLVLAFLGRFKTILIASVVFGVAIFLILNLILPTLMRGKGERIAVVGRYSSSELPPEVLNLIGEGLTKIDESGNPVSALAQSWEALDDGKTWKFHLAGGKFWQDGTPVTSTNIKYSFEDVVVETPDDQTVIFKLNEPFAPFPSVVSRPTFKKGLLGSGEWKVDNISLSGNYVSELSLVNDQNQHKIFKFYPSEERAKLAYKLGSVDAIDDLIAITPFDTWANTNITKEDNLKRFAAVFFNVDDPLLSEKSVRQALAYGIDKKSLDGLRATTNIWPGSWAYNSQTKPYDFDQKRAKELLENKEINIKLTTTPQLLTIAEKIASNWEQIGVHTEVGVESTIPQDYQAYLAIYDVPSDPDQYATWHSTQEETNITNYKNPRVDKLLEDGRQELNPEKRKQIYLDFQRFLLEDSPLAILYHPYSYSISRK